MSDPNRPGVVSTVFAAKNGIVVFPGALTPTEVVTSWELQVLSKALVKRSRPQREGTRIG